jgi:hypothetical protein
VSGFAGAMGSRKLVCFSTGAGAGTTGTGTAIGFGMGFGAALSTGMVTGLRLASFFFGFAAFFTATLRFTGLDLRFATRDLVFFAARFTRGMARLVFFAFFDLPAFFAAFLLAM